MAYCSLGVEATVRYSFGDEEQRIYNTNQTPINIEIESYTPPFAKGQCPIQYWVDFNCTFQFMEDPKSFVTHYFDGVLNQIPVYGKILDIYHLCSGGEPCGGQNSVRGCVIAYLDYRSNSIRTTSLTTTSRTPTNSIDHAYNDTWVLTGYQVTSIRPVQEQLDNCGDPKPVCTIKVLHNNQVIFSDRGDCPINYSVVCGPECPEGYFKCYKSGYPGYCCLPCAPIAAEIAGISSQVKTLNKDSVSYG